MLTSNEEEYARALEIMTRAEEMIRERKEVGGSSERGRVLDHLIRQLVVSGYYEHFKSSDEKPMFYYVYGVLAHVNYPTTWDSYQVHYAAQYGVHKGTKVLRELLGPNGFLTPIKREGYTGARFVFRDKIHSARVRRG